MIRGPLFIFWIVWFLAGCGLIPIEIPREATPAPPPTPILCTALPENMTFQVTPLTRTSLEITMTGLQPGEIPVVRVQTRTPNGSMDLEESSAQPVGASGQYSWTVHNLDFSSIGGAPPPYWQVMVTHAQGVACATVTLP